MTEQEIIQTTIGLLYESCVQLRESKLSFIAILAGLEKRFCLKALEGFAELLVDKPNHYVWCKNALGPTYYSMNDYDLKNAFCKAWFKARKAKGLSEIVEHVSPLLTLTDVYAIHKHWDRRWGEWPGMEKAVRDERFRKSVLRKAELVKLVEQTPV